MSSIPNFDSLALPQAVLKALSDAGYEQATEVQARAIPPALQGKDLMVSASTGSGKTASFILPALSRILAARGDNTRRREKGVIYGPRVLVLCPTRELAMQVAKAAQSYGRHVQGLRVATVVGGVPYPAQIKALSGPLDILISTPGRLLDHLQTGKAVLENVEMFVLDEADRMLDMGFIDDIQTVADHLPVSRQTLMYSATFAGHVGRLAQSLMRDGDGQTGRVDVASHTDTHENIEQRLHWADNAQHKNALLDHILTERDMEQAVVFTSTQIDADVLADRLAELGHAVASLHGGMPQGRRNRVLQGLRNRQLRILVATDVAARGIDVPTISHVINYGLPMKAEDYVHRIGRTGRAGRNGLAITLAERMDVSMIRRIQHFTTQAIPVASISGLEPKSPEPRLSSPRPVGGAGAPRHGDRAQAERGSRGNFRGAQGFKPRREDGFAPRRPAAGAWDTAPRQDRQERSDRMGAELHAKRARLDRGLDSPVMDRHPAPKDAFARSARVASGNSATARAIPAKHGFEKREKQGGSNAGSGGAGVERRGFDKPGFGNRATAKPRSGGPGKPGRGRAQGFGR
jgi:superfamily II DNA/RNA helicase